MCAFGEKTNYAETAVIKDKGYGNDSNKVENNIIRFGDAPIIFGDDPVRDDSKSYGNAIKDNFFDSSLATGIKLYYQNGAQVIGNKYVSTISGFDTAFYLSHCNNNLRINGNYILLQHGGSGLVLDNCDAYYSTANIISNNIIDIGPNSRKNCYGIYMGSTNFFDIVHNTIRIGRKQGQLTTNLFFDGRLSPSGSRNHYVFNNMFINESEGYTLWASSHSGSNRLIDSSDNNVFYSPKAGHITYNMGIGDIATWRYSSGFDSKSFFLYPKFINKDSMLTYDSRLNGQGAPWTKVTTDIQGDKRNATKPDIGADEFETLKNDVFVEAQVFPTGLICKGWHQAKVRIKNTGTDTLKSIILGYNIDDVFKDTISFKVSVPYDKDTILSLGKFYYGDTLRWYKIYSILPNNKFDRNQGNDTFLSPIRAALQDTYTVAKTGSYYNSLRMALNHLDSFGICGPVVFNIEDGYYEERMMVKNYHGSSGKNSVTFRGKSGDSSKVWIEPRFPDGYDSNYVVSINYAHNIIFEGVTISSALTDRRTVVEIKNNATQIQFRKCQVRSSYDFFDDAALIKTKENCDSIVVKGNLLKSANNGIWFEGKSNTSKIKNIIIEDNVFEDIWNINIYLNHINNVSIKRNVIDSGETGMDLDDISGNFIAAYNRIHLKLNFINYGYSNTGTGISLSGVFDKNKPGQISNNMIYVDGKNYANGIKASGLYLHVLYNTVKIKSEFNESSALSFYVSNVANDNRYINNILINTGPGYALSIWNYSGTYIAPYCDYNVLYTNGKYIGKGYTNRSITFKDWIKDNKLDSHSINVLPVFKDSFDLHTQSIGINGKAKPLANVTDDIDNEKRSATKPDIGADEFDPIAHDVAITGILPLNNSCADTAAYFGVIMENKGNNSETNFKLNLQITGADTVFVDSVYKATMVSGQIDTLYFSRAFNASKGGTYMLAAWHNLSADLENSNDSTYQSINLLKRHAVPVVSDFIICKGNDLVIKPLKPSGIKLLWYTSATQQTPFLIADSLILKNITKDAQYLVAAKDTIGCESYRMPIKITLKQVPAGAALQKGAVFNGEFNRGTENNPDAVCEGSENEYVIQKPAGFDNADYGKKWKISLLEIRGAITNTLMKDTAVTWPSASGAGKILIKSGITGTSRSYKIVVKFSDLSSGCDSTIERFFDVIALPKVNWGASSGCEGEWVNFTDSSKNGVAYLWQFSNHSTSTSKNKSFRFAKAGNYKVKLKVYNYLGCADSLEKTVTIHPVPEVDFELPAFSCIGENFSIINKTKFNSSLSYTWNFDDNTASADSSVSHAYKAVGIYAISLTATTAKGCSKTLTKFLRVYDKPEANFVLPDSVCAGEIATFTNSSKRSVSYLWSISSGDSFSSSHVNHIFTKPGNYSVKLIAYNASNCSDTLNKKITVLPKPEAAFDVSDICLGDSAVFYNRSKLTGQGNPTYLWRFGDGKTSSLENPTHLYTKAGLYYVKLIVESKSGCTDSITNKIKVASQPQAAFTKTNACLNENLLFSDQSKVTGARIVSRKWDFGDGKTSTDSFAQVKYSLPGKYPVTLQVVSEFGCTAIATDTIEVYVMPLASFSADTVCAGFATNFTNKSQGFATSTWYFGDGDSSFTTLPTHTYKAAGKYVVSLVVKSAQGCTDIKTDTVFVYGLPTASFMADTVCFGKATRFSNSSTSLLASKWYFGDGDSSNAASPMHVYKAAGDYTVRLQVANANGCINYYTQTVHVLELPTAAFSFTVGSNGNVSFSPDIKSNIKYIWYFGDGNLSDSIQPAHKYSKNGTYQVTLVTANSSGCTDSLSKQITVTNVGFEEALPDVTSIDIFPNPFVQAFSVKYSLVQAKRINLVLVDMYGKEIARKNLGKQRPGTHIETIEGEFSSGTYLLYIITDDKVLTRKVVKVN